MEAQLISAKLCREENGIFWKLTLADNNNNIIGTFGTKVDTINFRVFTFGLTKILNNRNLFNLTGKTLSSPILVKRTPTRVESIANKDGRFFSIDSSAKMSYGREFDTSDYEEATLTSLESKSGILQTNIDLGYSSQCFQAPEAYRGFKPVYNVDSSMEQQIAGANYFAMFIYQVLNVCKIDDLIQQGDKKYPKLSIALDEKENIIALGDVNKEIWLIQSKEGYTLSNTPIKIPQTIK